MARKQSSEPEEPVGAPTAYSVACRQCAAQIGFDEVPDTMLLECPECGETTTVPDTVGREDEIIAQAEEREE